MGDAGGFKADDMWGKTEDPNSGWKRNDPMVEIPALVANNTRLWVYCGNGTAQRAGWRRPARHVPRGPDHPHQPHLPATTTSPRAVTNGVFNFPHNGTHNWAYWGRELQADDARSAASPG